MRRMSMIIHREMSRSWQLSLNFHGHIGASAYTDHFVNGVIPIFFHKRSGQFHCFIEQIPCQFIKYHLSHWKDWDEKIEEYIIKELANQYEVAIGNDPGYREKIKRDQRYILDMAQDIPNDLLCSKCFAIRSKRRSQFQLDFPFQVCRLCSLPRFFRIFSYRQSCLTWFGTPVYIIKRRRNPAAAGIIWMRSWIMRNICFLL